MIIGNENESRNGNGNGNGNVNGVPAFTKPQEEDIIEEMERLKREASVSSLTVRKVLRNWVPSSTPFVPLLPGLSMLLTLDVFFKNLFGHVSAETIRRNSWTRSYTIFPSPSIVSRFDVAKKNPSVPCHKTGFLHFAARYPTDFLFPPLSTACCFFFVSPMTTLQTSNGPPVPVRIIPQTASAR